MLVRARSLLLGTMLFLPLAALPQTAVASGRDSVSESSYQALQWRLIGPFRGGRVTAVGGHPDHPQTFYMGATGGGVWKTTDAGQSWQNISDGFLKTGTIGTIAVAPSDPNIIYVGTGEGPIRGVTTSHGDGVYKSRDGGKTWQHVGLKASRQIARIVVDPTNPDLVYAAVQGNPWGASEDRGIYRTRDGGRNWQRIHFVDGTTGAADIDLDASNARTLYAAMWDHQREPWTIRSGGPGSSLWKSTDGGDSWRRLTQGLPGLMGKTSVVVSPADPNRLWAMIEATEGGVYRSDDAGQSWARVNQDAGIRDRGWYYTHVFAHPKDRDGVYILAAPMVVSKDGGVTFTEIETPHGDNHDLWINPRNPDVMVQGNDGGANVSFNGGESWSTQMNQPTAQFYRIETDLVFPYRIYTAQQDNTTIRIPSRALDGGIGEAEWKPVGGGESSFLSFDRKNPDLVYGTGLLGGITEYDDRTGTTRDIDSYPVFAGFRRGLDLKYRFNWNAPVLVSQHDPKVVYHAANHLLKTTDRGLTWQEISPDLTRARPETMGTTGGPIMIEGAGGEHYATLTYIAESPRDPMVIWTGSDDGLVHVTRDGGATWSNVTPAGLPEGQINTIDISPHAAGTAYIAVARYKLNDFAPYAFKTADYGKSWTPIAKGLPGDNFVRVVREDTVRPGLLYAGTEGGVFVSTDAGAEWWPLQLNLPTVPITDLKVHGDDLVAATQGRALWVLDGLHPLRELTPALAAAPVHLFAPAPTLRLEGGGRASEVEGVNPPQGAVIYYSFSSPPKGPVTMEILDAGGTVLRRFSSQAQAEARTELVKGAQGEPSAPPLTKKAGLNRYVWNLRPEPMTPVADTIRFVRNRPYRVGPGTYRVRLIADGRTMERPLLVLPHPGLPAATPEQWAEQQALSRKLYELVSDVHRETNEMRALGEQVRGRPDRGASGDQFLAALARWEEQVPQSPLPDGIQDKIGFPSRLLSTQILHTLALLDGPPPVPEATKLRVRELEAEWARMRAEAAQLRRQATADLGSASRAGAAAR